MIAKANPNKEQLLKDIQDWEREYNGMDVPRTKREQQILDGDPIKSLSLIHI